MEIPLKNRDAADIASRQCRPTREIWRDKWNWFVPNRSRRTVYDPMGTHGSTGDERETPGVARRPPASTVGPGGLEAALAVHRDRLRRMVALRLDRRLRGRVDPSDVIQEAFLEARGAGSDARASRSRCPRSCGSGSSRSSGSRSRTDATSRRGRGTPGARCRSRRGISPAGDLGGHRGAAPRAGDPRQRGGHAGRAEAEAAGGARRDGRPGPRGPRAPALRAALQRRVARVLGIGESAATKRYIRALGRLKDILSAPPGAGSGFWR